MNKLEIDKENAIRAVDICFDYWLEQHKFLDPLALEDARQLKADAIALLKRQEAVSITTDYFDGFGNKTSRCPSCNSRLVWHQNKNYCGECGRSVKWE